MKHVIMLMLIALKSVLGTKNTKQWEQSFMLKETASDFDGVQTHVWQAPTDNESDTLLRNTVSNYDTFDVCYILP